MRHPKCSLAAAAVLLALVLVSPAGAVTTVSPDGATSTTLQSAIAIAAAGDGQITMLPGVYPGQVITAWPSSMVTVEGRGAVTSYVAMKGAHHLTLKDLTVAGGGSGVSVDSVSGSSNPSDDIHIEAADISSSGACFKWENIATRVSLADSRLHDCGVGLVAPGRPDHTPSLSSDGVTITDNLITHITQDGAQISDTDDLAITDNVFSWIDDAGPIHNDGIQVTGGVHRATILGNSISHTTQGIFLQDRTDTTYRDNDSITVKSNVTHDLADADVQSQGVTNAVFQANAFCQNRNGYYALWLRPGNTTRSDGTRSMPTDTTVEGNALASYHEDYVGAAAVFLNNVLGC